MGKTDIIVIELLIDKEKQVTTKRMNGVNNHTPNYITNKQTNTHISISGEISIQFSKKSTNFITHISAEKHLVLVLVRIKLGKAMANPSNPRPAAPSHSS